MPRTTDRPLTRLSVTGLDSKVSKFANLELWSRPVRIRICLNLKRCGILDIELRYGMIDRLGLFF